MDMRKNFWYFGDKPRFRIHFSKDVPLPVDDSPVEINSSSCPTNSIPSEVPIQSNPVDETETNDLHLRGEGQTLNVEERNYLMVLLNESNDFFRLGEEPTSFIKNFIQKQAEKSGLIDIEAGKNKYLLEISNAPTRGNTAENSFPDEANDVDATPETDSSTKPEGNASVMTNDRASGSKGMRIGTGNEPRSEKDYFAEARHDTSTVTDLSYRPSSYIPSNKRNERTNYTIQTENMMGKEREFLSHRSNSDTSGRRYGRKSYEKYNNKNQNYQDARRQNYDNEVNNKSDCVQISNESLNEAHESISPSDKECFQNNKLECNVKIESKSQDICAGNSSNSAFIDRQRRNAYRSGTHFRDGRRDSFKRGRQNRGYRNQNNERQHPSSYRLNNYHYQGGKFAQENNSGRSYNRRSRWNSYRYSREENLH
ncbi:retrovirus-related Pol polyprotein from transposon 412 [Trichonephila inaurata madagascariensis]|uniref:Retrovirus-related Pol polyprotein from transposon 412 n=1 Tax=Trichonephila inaurata madagascariensis TaxID=2747483 RepID=A0A8X6WWT2_9ARAC|nr:retrovirus-related Pol polyprotein from transposon 412 [Trichonephila inaurata madagascariensis]